MAESVSEAGKALTKLTLSAGGIISISISSENVQVVESLATTVRDGAVILCTLYAAYQLEKAVIDAAVKIALGGNREDQEIRDTREGSLLVVLHCKTDKRFMEVLEDYETGRMGERFVREFSKIEGIKVHGLKVEISNMDEVIKTRKDIEKRSTSKIPKEHEECETSEKSTLKRQESEMKPLPDSQMALRQEAYALGLIGPNPSLKNPRTKLLKCVKNSIAIKRSINHVSILLVGHTGVGKSSTINHLLGTNGEIEFAKINDSESKTRSTQEFIIYGDEPEYAVKDLALGLIDTPGFGDTDGTHQDACNIVSIKKFFRTHPSLSGSYPNLIFVITKANDNRISGENSDLGKLLRCIRNLKLVDPDHPNVVGVLTHACETSVRNVTKWSAKMEEKKDRMEAIIYKTLKVTAPVVLLENLNGKDDAELEVCGDYTRLPNGVLQPKNLYDACAGVLKKSNDDIGLITLNSIFVSAAKCAPRRGHEIKAKSAKDHDDLDDEERQCAISLKSSVSAGEKDYIENVVSEYTKKKNLGPQEREELFQIACVLRRLGVGDPPSFGSHSIGSIEYTLGNKISSTGQELLQEEFKIPMPFYSGRELLQEEFINIPMPFYSGVVIGQGYNIMRAELVDTSVMKFNDTQACSGIVIPACAQFRKVEQTKSSTNQYDQKSSSMSELSFYFERRLFEITMSNYKEYQNKGMAFTRDFTSAVDKLPKEYKRNDEECRRCFEKLFNQFGHSLVSSAYGGGSAKVTCSKEMIGNAEREELKAYLMAWFEGLDVRKTREDGSLDVKILFDRFQCFCEGGDTSIIPQGAKIPDKENLEKWKLSLPAKPTLLTSKMKLQPISTAVACVDPEKEDGTYDALKDFCGNKFQLFVDTKKTREATSEKMNPQPTSTAAARDDCKKQDAMETHEATSEKMKDANTRAASVEKPKDDGNTCFPSSSVVNVTSKDGVMTQKKMADLGVGEKVMAWDEKRNRAIFTEVIMFAHRETDTKDVKYLKITLEDGTKITLSANHLVMVGKHKKAIMAQKVKLGDILFTVDENQEISPKKVLSIDQAIEQGVYCPITSHGNVIIDNVLASCYASVQDHIFLRGLVKVSAQRLAHLGLMPMRVLHKLRLKSLRKFPEGQAIHPYLQWLCKLKLPFMAN